MNNTKGMNWHQRFFWLLLLLLPTQLGYHFWPEWAGVLGRRVDYLAPTIYLTDILIFLIIVAWFVPRVIQMVRRNPKSKFLNPKWFDFVHHLFEPEPQNRRPEPVEGQIQRIKIQMLQTKHLWVMAGVVFAAVNILVAANRPVAVYKWLKVSEFVLLGWYIVKTRVKLSAISFPLSVGIFYSSVLAIAQFILQHSIGGPLWWLGERTFAIDTPGIAMFDLCQVSRVMCQEVLRPYGTFPHPNVLGGFLAAVLPLLIYNLQIYKSTNLQINGRIIKMYQWFLGVTFVVGIVALLLTFSRSAIGVGIVGIGASIWYLVFRKKKHLIFSYILYTIPFILFFVVMAWSFSPNEESVVVRQQLNAAAIKLWQTSPLFGVGLGNFLVRLPDTLPTRTIYFLQPVHNIYLLVLVEVGVVGSIFFLWLLWCAIESQKSKAKQAGRARNSNSSLLTLSLLTLLLLGLVDHYPLTLQQGQLLLTVMIGMSLIFLQ